MVYAYIDTSATYNGDGTVPDQATSDGGVGAYNNIQTFLNDVNVNDKTTGILRRLNLGSVIFITSAFSCSNDGTAEQSLSLIGYPFSKSVDNIPINDINTLSRPYGDKFLFRTTDDRVGDSGYYDHFWEGAYITIHQAGTSNDGLVRKCIWSEFDGTGMVIGLFPNLPEPLTTEATFDITLTTSEYGNITVPAWDNDTNSRPIIDSGNNNINVFGFSGRDYWKAKNLCVIGSSSYTNMTTFYGIPSLESVVVDRVGGTGLRPFSGYGERLLKDVYISVGYWGIVFDALAGASNIVMDHVHINRGNPGLLHPTVAKATNISISKVKDCNLDINHKLSSGFFSIDCIESIGSNFSYINRSAGHYQHSTFTRLLTRDAYYDKYDITSTHFCYTIKSDSSLWSTPPSGVDTVMVIEPISLCSPDYNTPFYIHPVYVTANVTKTVTIYFRPVNWSENVTNKDIWFELRYFNEPNSINSITISTKGDGSTTYANDTWNSISVSFVPKQTGLAYVDCFFSCYEDSAYMLIDLGSGM